MYSPKYAIETDEKRIHQVIKDNPFATVVYQQNGRSESFPLPLLLEDNKLVGHLALANPAWKDLDGTSALLIFHGPHCYISPTWYGGGSDVPTWNYVAVHVRGKVSITRDEAFLSKVLTSLSKKYDPDFDIDKNIADNKNLFSAIVGIEVEMEEVFAKFKLAQKKPLEARQNVIRKLESSTDSQHRKVGEAMRATLEREND